MRLYSNTLKGSLKTSFFNIKLLNKGFYFLEGQLHNISAMYQVQYVMG